MSAPTLTKLEIQKSCDTCKGTGIEPCWEPSPCQGEPCRACFAVGTITTAATPADVRLWLLENGAVERQWCETHADYAMVWLEVSQDSCRWAAKVNDEKPCRMVSVLVYKEDSE